MFLTIVIFVFVLGLLVFVHELGHFLAARAAKVKVEEFGFGFPPKIWSKKVGTTIYSINLIPLGGFVKLYGEEGKHLKDPKSFFAKPLASRFWVIVAGVLMNLVLAWVLFWFGFNVGLPVTSTPADQIKNAKVTQEVIISEALPDTPAQKAGLSRGDIVIAGNGQAITTPEQLSEFTQNHIGQKADFTIKRYGLKKNLEITLSKDKKAPLGVAVLESERVKVPFFQAPIVAIKEIYNLIKLIVLTLIGFFATLFATGKATDVGTGPVGIWFIFKVATKLGLPYILQLTALISVNLAIVNILPFPALDGGRLIFWMIEAVSRKRVAPRIEGIIHAIGFAILIALIILITFRDIMNLK